MVVNSNMICPSCGKFQSRDIICESCGVIIEKAQNQVSVEKKEKIRPKAKNKISSIHILGASLLLFILVAAISVFSNKSTNNNEANNIKKTVTTDNKNSKIKVSKKSDIEKIAAFNPEVANRIQQVQVGSKLRLLKTALHINNVEGFEPPSNEQGLQLLVDQGQLTQQEITDEWGNIFNYRLEWGKQSDILGREYKIFIHSSGPDGISGTEDDIHMP